jgi:hypothetical protein
MREIHYRFTLFSVSLSLRASVLNLFLSLRLSVSAPLRYAFIFCF